MAGDKLYTSLLHHQKKILHQVLSIHTSFALQLTYFTTTRIVLECNSIFIQLRDMQIEYCRYPSLKKELFRLTFIFI